MEVSNEFIGRKELKKEDFDISTIDCAYIRKAFEKSAMRVDMLTVQEFYQMSGFPIDAFMVDKFFINIDKSTPVYISDETIEWCDFGSKEFNRRKDLFVDILTKFTEGTDYWMFNNSEYIKYYKEAKIENQQNDINYPNPDIFKGRNRTKHIVLTVRCFKKILMMLN